MKVTASAVPALLTPWLVVALLWAAPLAPGAEPDGPRAPQRRPVTTTDLVCPPALTDEVTWLAAPSGRAEGTVRIRTLGTSSSTTATVDGSAPVSGPAAEQPQVITARRALARTVAAGRWAEGSPVAGCRSPATETWFTGIGASAEHASTLYLTNPDGGPAVADLTVYGRRGPKNPDDIAEVKVSGHDSVAIDFAEELPTASELAVKVAVTRGRVAPFVRDTTDELGAGPTATTWLEGQPAPTTAQVLLGLPPGEGPRSLVLANPGPDEALVDLRIVSPDGWYTPDTSAKARVPAESVKVVDVTDVVSTAAADGDLGLAIESTAPVTATLRSPLGAFLADSTPVEVGTRAKSLLPPGATRLVLAPTTQADAVAHVVIRDPRAEVLLRDRFDVVAASATTVDLPAGATVVDVRVSEPTAAAVFANRDTGLVVLPLTTWQRQRTLPSVRPEHD